jgi:hypothetical protein
MDTKNKYFLLVGIIIGFFVMTSAFALTSLPPPVADGNGGVNGAIKHAAIGSTIRDNTGLDLIYAGYDFSFAGGVTSRMVLHLSERYVLYQAGYGATSDSYCVPLWEMGYDGPIDDSPIEIAFDGFTMTVHAVNATGLYYTIG